MCKLYLRLALFLLGTFLGTSSGTAATGPFALLHSLRQSGTNAHPSGAQATRVAIDGNIAVVGAPVAYVGSDSVGMVKVYDVNAGTLLHTLSNPNPARYGFFGSSVAISGTRVVVGAMHDSAGATYSGSAYLYDLTNATPATPILTLTNPSPADYDDFGNFVAICGTKVVVGASSDDTQEIDAGSVYVYDTVSSMPSVPIVTLTSPHRTRGQNFGGAIAISGSWIVVGAPFDEIGIWEVGSVFVFNLASATPTLPVFTLSNPSPAFREQFGASVAISGKRVVVGKPGDSALNNEAGSALVYDLAGVAPETPTLRLCNLSAPEWDRFGTTVAIFSNMVAAGCSSTQGVHVFDLSGVEPHIPIATLGKPNLPESVRILHYAALSGTRVMVGALYDDAIAMNTGSAFIFGPRPSLQIAPTAPGLATLSWSPAASSGFALQYADVLAPTNWLNALGGETNPVTLSLTNAARFYRLRGP